MAYHAIKYYLVLGFFPLFFWGVGAVFVGFFWGDILFCVVLCLFACLFVVYLGGGGVLFIV